MMGTIRGRPHVPTQLGVGAHMPRIRSCCVDIRQHLGLPASPCWRQRNRALLPPQVEPAGGGLPVVAYQIGVRLLCAGEQQGPLEVQHLDNTGEPVTANNVWAQASPGQAGLPPASSVAASANRPGQASMSASVIPVGGSLSFRRIVDVPFETCVAALDSWQRTGHGELRVGESLLRGPVEHDREAGTRRIQVRLARGSLRPLQRMRLDIDRWSASSTVVELIPCGRVRPTAAYFRAGHLLLDLLTRSLLQHLPAADARDTASQPQVPVSSGRP